MANRRPETHRIADSRLARLLSTIVAFSSPAAGAAGCIEVPGEPVLLAEPPDMAGTCKDGEPIGPGLRVKSDKPIAGVVLLGEDINSAFDVDDQGEQRIVILCGTITLLRLINNNRDQTRVVLGTLPAEAKPEDVIFHFAGKTVETEKPGGVDRTGIAIKLRPSGSAEVKISRPVLRPVP